MIYPYLLFYFVRHQPTHMQALSPVQQKDREVFMDVLRGFAILGIFIANLGSGFSFYREGAPINSPYLLPELDHKMSFLHHMFIEGKFYSIFSLLFGWGIALQIKRGMAAGINTMPAIRRRLLFHALAGCHPFTDLAGRYCFLLRFAGFILLPLRKFSNKTLLVTGIILILSPIFSIGLKMTWPVTELPGSVVVGNRDRVDAALMNIQSEEQFIQIMKEGNWFDHAKDEISQVFFSGIIICSFLSRVPKVLGMFLIGYVIGRSDFYKNLQQYKKQVYWIIGIGLADRPSGQFLPGPLHDLL